MNTALQTTQEHALESQHTELPVDISFSDLQAAIAGNLAKLSPEGQVKYYNALCKFTGLNPLGFPFEWITFQGKLKLYPKKECADQLRGVHHISAKILERTFFDDICMVRVMSTMPDGREFESTGAVPYQKSMPALERCKALKVAETQAYRRGTFGLVGLGNLPDEDSEGSERASAQVEALGEESAGARAEKLNAALEYKSIEVETISDGGGLRPPGRPLDTKASPPSVSISQERTAPLNVQPPIEVTATAENRDALSTPAAVAEPTHSVSNTPPPVSSSDDDFGPQTPPKPEVSEDEVFMRNFETVLSESPDSIPYIVAQKRLVKGAGLGTIDKAYAGKIIKNPQGFHRAVAAWVKGGRK